ncbi:VapE domain-containing protein [Massilia sp. W12]|uniref:VapE domain-containing protein n=1 Tax=Massilia sp. W12 TaxID=3126507 RepID=UPI0030CAC2E9
MQDIKDYLTTCEEQWDRKGRIAHAFATYWGAADTAYTRLVSRIFFCSMVMRAHHPGEPLHYAPVFMGGQGAGKSEALAILGGKWFSDAPFSVGKKEDAGPRLNRIWLYEIAELDMFTRAEIAALKAIISSTTYHYRERLTARRVAVPLITCFACTTSDNTFFHDSTSHRRFWPVAVQQVDLDALRRDRDMLFGEAVHMWENGALWFPTREEERHVLAPALHAADVHFEQNRHQLSGAHLRGACGQLFSPAQLVNGAD